MPKRFVTLAWVAAGSAYLLIVLGAVVRISGSGMGCGDHWPLCNGHLFPPLGDIPTVIEASYFVPGTHRDCVIVGERGSLVADYASATVTLHLGEFVKRDGAWEAVDTGKEELPARGEEPLRRELAAFLDACAGGTPSPVDASAGVQALVVVEAAARAAALGRTVTL